MSRREIREQVFKILFRIEFNKKEENLYEKINETYFMRNVIVYDGVYFGFREHLAF